MSECKPGCKCGENPATKMTPAEQRTVILKNLRYSRLERRLKNEAIASVEPAQAYANKFGDDK
jgi:hypothetical protein